MREAAAKKGLDLTLAKNAFLLGKKTPQFVEPWLLYGFPDLGTALKRAGRLAREGNTQGSRRTRLLPAW